MKVKVNGFDVECSPSEFRELVGIKEKEFGKPLEAGKKKVDGRLNNGKHFKKRKYERVRKLVRWDDSQDGFLVANAGVYPRKKLARMFNKEFGTGRTVHAISTRLWELGNKGVM